MVLNSGGAANAEIKLPDGRWMATLDEHDASSVREVSGKVSVRQRSGPVLHQR